MSIHEKMESIADLYVAGGLSADERREADQHAAACADCAALLRDARDFAAWARGAIAPDAPPADLEDRLIQRFRAAGQTKKRRFPVGKRIVKVTASIAAAVALVFLGNMFSEQDYLKTLANAAAEYRQDTGVEVLSDGLALETVSLPRKAITFDYASKGTPQAGQEFAHYFGRDLGEEGKNRTLARGGDGSVKSDEKLATASLSAEAAGTGGGGGGRYGGRFGGRENTVNRLSESESVDKLGALKQQASADELGRRNLAVTRGSSTPTTPEPAAVQDTRKIIRTGDVALEVESYEATYTKLSALMTAEKGQISSANTQKMANGKIRATVILRVPPERFEAVLTLLKEFGTIQNQNIGSQDVTKAYIDLETRLKSKEILAERLKALLKDGKGTVKELMEVEVQLGATNEAIEQIKGEIKYYDNQVGMSTLT